METQAESFYEDPNMGVEDGEDSVDNDAVPDDGNLRISEKANGEEGSLSDTPLNENSNSLQTESSNAGLADANGDGVDAEFAVDRDQNGTVASESWTQLTGLKWKQYTANELDAFKKPFEIGWKREVVLRGTVSSSGKKTGDVYYFSPDKKIKLRSYVEMGLFLRKNPDCGLEPENFTFARQPIYTPPDEVVRHAMHRGSSLSDLIVATPLPAPVAPVEVTPVRESRRQLSTGSASDLDVSEGRGKRRAKAPSRFEDEDYSQLTSTKKKPRLEKTDSKPVTSPAVVGSTLQTRVQAGAKSILQGSASKSLLQVSPRKNSGVKLTIKLGAPPPPLEAPMIQPPTTQSPVSEPPETKDSTEPQTFQSSPPSSPPSTPIVDDVKEEFKPSKRETSDEGENVESETSQQETTQNGLIGIALKGLHQMPMMVTSTPLLARKLTSNKISRPKPTTFQRIMPKPMGLPQTPKVEIMEEDSEDFSYDEAGTSSQQSTPVAPCSMMCGGSSGSVPTAFCVRCLCMFHPECVPNGIYVGEQEEFVCPNCVQPSDKGKKVSVAMGVRENGNGGRDRMIVEEVDDAPAPLRTTNQKAKAAQLFHNQRLAQASLHAGHNGTVRSLKPILPKPPASIQRQLNLLASSRNPPQEPQRRVQQLLPAQNGNHAAALPRFSSRPPQQQIIQKSGHLQISHPIFSTQPQNKPRKALAQQGPLLSRGLHRQMSKMIHSQLKQHNQQAYYQSPQIAPIAPITMTPVQVASFLEHKKNKRRRGYKEYMRRVRPPISLLGDGYTFLNNALQQLNVKDLNALRQTNRMFKDLVSQPLLWQSLKLKAVHIVDWQYLGQGLIEKLSSTEVDFDGIRAPFDSKQLAEVWHNFATIIDYLKSVKVLKFGTVPYFIIDEITTAASTENCYNSFSNLESLSVKNIFDETSDAKKCGLSFLENLSYLSNLTTLKIACRNGLTTEGVESEFLEKTFASLPNLKSLSLPNLKNFNYDNFSFLAKLPQLTELEIGSCVSWTNDDEDKSSDSIGENAVDDVTELRGAYKYLSHLVNLVDLKLVEVILDETSVQLPLALQRMPALKSLSFDALTVSPDAADTLDHLVDTLQQHLPSLTTFSVTSEDAQTNKSVFEMFKKLQNVKKIVWKVGAIVEDCGECYVPLEKDRADESDMDGELDLMQADDAEIMDVNSLTDVLQKHLPSTTILIVPQ